MEALVCMILAVWLLAALVARALRGRRARPAPVVYPTRPAIRRAPVREDVPHALYAYLWASRPGRRYIGISNEPAVRHRRHETDPDAQWWFQQTTGVMHVICWYPNRDTARAAERATVRAAALNGEDPANDHHNPLRRRARRAARP